MITRSWALLTFLAFSAPFLLVLAAGAWAWRRGRRPGPKPRPAELIRPEAA